MTCPGPDRATECEARACRYGGCQGRRPEIDMVRRIDNGTVVEISAGGTRITLPGGQVVEGRPHDTDDYRATAQRLAYIDDTLGMCRDHDPLHAMLCDWLGLPSSFALRVAAGLDADHELAQAEEDAVLMVQRFMRLAGAALPGPWVLLAPRTNTGGRSARDG